MGKVCTSTIKHLTCSLNLGYTKASKYYSKSDQNLSHQQYLFSTYTECSKTAQLATEWFIFHSYQPFCTIWLGPQTSDIAMEKMNQIQAFVVFSFLKKEAFPVLKQKWYFIDFI